MKKEFLEQSILGTMLEENYLIKDSQLKPDMFIGQYHRQLFSMMLELAQQNHPVDYVTLSARFQEVDQIGIHYVTELIHFADAEKFDGYVQVLREAWRERQKAQILNQAYTSDWSIAQTIHELDRIQLEGDYHDASITHILVDMENRPFEDVQTPGLIVPHLDNLALLIDGFRPGELTILAARPSMGKTDVMNNLALYAGWAGHLPILFSLEMSKRTLMDRLIATTGNYSRLKLRNPKKYFTKQQTDNWLHVLNRVLKSNIHIDDRSSLTIAQIRSQARRIIRKHPHLSPIIIIDYLQIIQAENDQDYSTVAISKISRGLKQIAKEFNCPIICLSQLNRNVESRGVKRPMMSDLRDSGSIEQDADIIILLYRESYYKPDEDHGPEKLELIVAKNRNGPTGSAFASYNRMTGHIQNEVQHHEVER